MDIYVAGLKCYKVLANFHLLAVCGKHFKASVPVMSIDISAEEFLHESVYKLGQLLFFALRETMKII